VLAVRIQQAGKKTDAVDQPESAARALHFGGAFDALAECRTKFLHAGGEAVANAGVDLRKAKVWGYGDP